MALVITGERYRTIFHKTLEETPEIGDDKNRQKVCAMIAAITVCKIRTLISQGAKLTKSTFPRVTAGELRKKNVALEGAGVEAVKAFYDHWADNVVARYREIESDNAYAILAGDAEEMPAGETQEKEESS